MISASNYQIEKNCADSKSSGIQECEYIQMLCLLSSLYIRKAANRAENLRILKRASIIKRKFDYNTSS